MRDRPILSEGVGASVSDRPLDIRRPFVLVGGFPCQDLSVAGERRGLVGHRSGLWTEFARAAMELRPDWVVIENVAHTWRKWVPEVRRALFDVGGYASLPLRVRASDLGAYHERSRIFIIAHTDCELLWELQGWWLGPGRKVAKELAQSWDFAPRRLGAHDGIPNRVDRRRAIGNAIVPQIAQIIAEGIKAVSARRTG